MIDCKHVLLMLFYNVSNRTHYIAIGNCLCPIKAVIATAIQEREQIEIHHAEDIKQMQIMCNNNYSKPPKQSHYESNSIHY